jgi:hypothetical protein
MDDMFTLNICLLPMGYKALCPRTELITTAIRTSDMNIKIVNTHLFLFSEVAFILVFINLGRQSKNKKTGNTNIKLM